jgi:hypothetical protein
MKIPGQISATINSVPNATKTSSIRMRRLAQGKAPAYKVEKIENVNSY